MNGSFPRLCLLGLIAVPGLAAAQVGAARTGSRAPGAAVAARARYLGLAGWEVSDGKIVILVDPYISRVDGPPGDLTPPPPGTDFRLTLDDVAIADTAAVDSVLGAVHFILVTHAHYVHMMDVPYIARTRHATVIGNESVTNIARACTVAEQQLVTVRGGEHP